jgi:hypothetical protein
VHIIESSRVESHTYDLDFDFDFMIDAWFAASPFVPVLLRLFCLTLDSHLQNASRTTSTCVNHVTKLLCKLQEACRTSSKHSPKKSKQTKQNDRTPYGVGDKEPTSKNDPINSNKRQSSHDSFHNPFLFLSKTKRGKNEKYLLYSRIYDFAQFTCAVSAGLHLQYTW